jgi:hypothetical protein
MLHWFHRKFCMHWVFFFFPSRAEPLWHCHDRVDNFIDIQLHPNLSVYTTSQYKENELITTKVGSNILYTWDFESPKVQNTSCYVLTQDPDSLMLNITQYALECPLFFPAHLPDTSQAYGNLYTHIQCWLGSMVPLGSSWACWWMVEEKLLLTWILFWPMHFLVI